jgi:predicted nucleic acid-binding protein
VTQITAVLDACVLYPAPLRDLLMELALADLFRAKWTDEIHNEWIRNLLKNRPDLTLERLQRTKNLMNTFVRDCLVTDYDFLIPTLILPDKQDRHVLAAAICSGANLIITSNLSDFPIENLKKYQIEAKHPDDFIFQLIDLYPSQIYKAIRDIHIRLKNPPLTIDSLLETYEKLGLSQTVIKLKLKFT